MPQNQHRTVYLKDYLPPAFLVSQVELTFEIYSGKTRVHSKLNLTRNSHPSALAAPLRLNGQDLELVEVCIDGMPLATDRYRVDQESLTVEEMPDQCMLEVVTQICPEENTSLEGLYRSRVMYCTQCEAEGFRKITYFPDRPDVMACYSTRIEADLDSCPILLSNGNLVEEGLLGNGRHYAVWKDPFPKPSYLFALVAGRLACLRDEYRTGSGRNIDLRIYVEEQNLDLCGHAMQSLKKSMLWDEQTYGLECDLDSYLIVAVDDFNMGAMENKGLNIFNSKYVLARPETATDADFQAIEGVIGHEYFHNWTGNRVTCRDWFQLSLKEGLTVFRDQEFSSDMNSRAVKRIEDVRLLRNSQFPEDAGPMSHPVRPESYMEINNFYTMTVYHKGAEVIRMQHTLLGKAGFRRGIDLYFQRYDGQAVTTDDFVQTMADANEVDLSQFRLWYSQAGTPELDVCSEYDAAGNYRLTVKQSCPATPGQPSKQPFHLPLSIGLLDAAGKDLPLQLNGENGSAETTKVLQVRQAEETFTFVDIKEKPVPSLLRGFSAPVKLKYPYSDEELAFLWKHDSDAFNRWEAGQNLALRFLLGLTESLQKGQSLSLSPFFIDAFRTTLLDWRQDPALTAHALALPTETYLGEQMQVIDPVAVRKARQQVRQELGAALYAQFIEVYRACCSDRPDSVDPWDIGLRSLKNLCLGYLMAIDDESARQLCLAQYGQAGNMTDRMGALTALANSAAPQRQEILAGFYDDWQQNALVVDKWFTLQATAHRPEVLQEVKALLGHPAFSRKNPNKVRSLIGAFAHGNPAAFHAEDGSGYRFVADEVLTLDPLNPQVAARMVSAFNSWRRYDERRQAFMTDQLERILGQSSLSGDVYEIVAKSLGRGSEDR